MTRWLVFCLFSFLAACSGNEVKKSPDITELNPHWPDSVGEVSLVSKPGTYPESSLLDIGLVIFDSGIPDDPASLSKLGIFPEIRRAEARYLPYVLRQTLVDSQAWGAVRVLPKPDETAQLLVTGKIVHSDGSHLVLQIRAVDATGRVWLDRIYHDESKEYDYPVQSGQEPYADIHEKISNDLLAARERLAAKDLTTVADVALLQYASSLSPDAFAGFVAEDEEGQLVIQRLPAQGDPMLDRVRRIQNQEYLFIDNTDEQYQALYEQMAPTYNLWRQNGRELAVYKVEYEERIADRDRNGKRGTYSAMTQTYNAYKRSKEHDQDLDELAEGFNNEVSPTVMEVEGRVFRLNGSLEAQYTEWRSILRSIFALETGLTPVQAP